MSADNLPVGNGPFKVNCSECGTEVERETEQEARETVNTHNESQHNGEEVAAYVGKNPPEGKVRWACEQCSVLEVAESESEAWDAVEEHNDTEHNGRDVAGPFKWDVETAEDLLRSMQENMDREEFLSFAMRLNE